MKFKLSTLAFLFTVLLTGTFSKQVRADDYPFYCVVQSTVGIHHNSYWGYGYTVDEASKDAWQKCVRLDPFKNCKVYPYASDGCHAPPFSLEEPR